MKLNSLLSLVSLGLFTSSCFAQNELLIMKPGDSIPGVLTVTNSSDFFERYNYHLSAPPAQLAGAIPLTVDYTKAASLSLNAFQRYPLGDYGFSEPGVVLFPFLKEGFDGAVKPENDKTPVRESMKKALCSSRQVRELIYAWMMPYFQKSFSVMSVNEQEGYLTALARAKEFTTNLDIEKEKKVVKKAVDYAGDVGRLQAFIYRRIANNELTKEECLEWLNKIITDLSAVKNTNPDPEDHYVVRSEHGYGIYLASVYNAKSTYAESYVLRKQNGKYSLMPNVSFDDVNQCGKNLLIGLHSHYPDPATYGYLYYDSTGAFYKETLTQLPSTDIVMKGSGRSGRALLFYSPDYYEYVVFDSAIGDVIGRTGKIGVCCVLDIDSGYLVRDSMYIPIVETPSDNGYDVDYSYPSANSPYMIFSDGAYGNKGLIGPNGNIVLEPEYETIELTADPNIFELNGKENFDARTGGKTKIK